MTFDVALLSLGTTLGLRRSDDALAELIVAAGATCRVVRVEFGATGALRRHIAVTDLIEGIAARRAARATSGARSMIVSGATTALLLRRPAARWAIRFDSPTSLNRLGWSGAWQRARERRVLPAADLLLPWGEAAAEAAEALLDGAAPRPRMIRLPNPVEAPAPVDAGARRPEAVAYAGWLWKRGIDVLCAAWGEAAVPGARLVIGGCDRETGRAWLRRCDVAEPPGIEWAGTLPRDEWLDRVARARVFVNASRREDHGLAQLEALAAGTPVVTVPSPGPYEALPIARRLAPELIAADVSAPALAAAMRAGFSLDVRARTDYAARAVEALAPYRRARVLDVVRSEVLPALGVAGDTLPSR
jgi:glycosyltransferase involved in cell wall biosynthesis